MVSSNLPGSEVPGVPGGRSSGVLQYDTTTGELLNTISTGPISSTISGPQPVDVAIGGPDNNLFISSSSTRFNSGGISEYDLTTGEFVRGLPIQVQFLSPRSIAATGSNIFYIDLLIFPPSVESIWLQELLIHHLLTVVAVD